MWQRERGNHSTKKYTNISYEEKDLQRLEEIFFKTEKGTGPKRRDISNH